MSEGLKTYSGVVTTVADPEIGSTGNEKPRRVVIKKDLNEQYGKTFRIWSNHDDFPNLVMGQPITVEYIEQPNPDPQRKPSNIIQSAWATEGAGVASGTPTPVAQPTKSAPSAGPSGDDPWGPTPHPNAQTAATSMPVATNGNLSYSKDDYWERREATDEQRQREIEAAWGINATIALYGVLDATLDKDKLHAKAHELIVLKKQIASELAS